MLLATESEARPILRREKWFYGVNTPSVQGERSFGTDEVIPVFIDNGSSLALMMRTNGAGRFDKAQAGTPPYEQTHGLCIMS